MSPEHLHLVLNHLPLAGAAFAALALLLGLLFRSPAACRAGMALALAATAVTPAVMETGEKARAAVALGAPLDPAAAPWLHEHEERAEALAPLLYATFLASAAALALSWRKPAGPSPSPAPRCSCASPVSAPGRGPPTRAARSATPKCAPAPPRPWGTDPAGAGFRLVSPRGRPINWRATR
jgi:hypothetical protein